MPLKMEHQSKKRHFNHGLLGRRFLADAAKEAKRKKRMASMPGEKRRWLEYNRKTIKDQLKRLA